MDEVAATIAGFRMGEIDAFKSMKYKVGQISAELANARKVFINRSISANSLMSDFGKIEQGLPPTNINTNFLRYQKNRYRIWSEAWKDIEALRTIGYSEFQIREMLEGRRAFSKDEVKMLMLGRFEPAKIPKINLMNENGFSAMIKNINREKGTYYTPNQFYNIYDLNDIYQAWRAVPLGQDPTLIEQEINVPFDVRAEEIKEDVLDYEDIIKDQNELMEEKIKEDAEGYEKSIKDQQSKTTAPIGTPPLNNEIFAASRVYPTISGSQVNEQTGLTGTQEALLDPTEKLIAQRQNQGLGSLA